MVSTSLVPRLHPAFQCFSHATLKSGWSLGTRLGEHYASFYGTLCNWLKFQSFTYLPGLFQKIFSTTYATFVYTTIEISIVSTTPIGWWPKGTRCNWLKFQSFTYLPWLFFDVLHYLCNPYIHNHWNFNSDQVL